MKISTGMRIYIVEEGFEVPDYGMPRCEPLRNLVDFLCVQEESHAFRGTFTEGPKGEDQFRCIIDSDGAGKPTTVVSLRKSQVGRCDPEDLEYRYDDSGSGRPLEKFIEKLNTVWLPRFADVALTVSIVNKDGSFEACKTNGKFRVRLNFEPDDEGIVWSTEPVHTVDARLVASSGQSGVADVVPRPRGRPPAGKTWDGEKGRWVDEGEKKGEEDGEEDGDEDSEEAAEEDDKFGAELLRKLSTHERRICACVYTFANGQADAYVSRGVLMYLLKGLGVSKPQELLQEARIKGSHNLVHNGQAGINAALALTASGVQYIKTHLDFETGSTERAVTFLKTLYTDDRSAPVTEEDTEEANTPPPAKKAKAGKQNPTSADTATSAKRSGEGGEEGEAHAKKLADAAIEAAEATLKSINALEACLKHLHDAYPQDVNTSEVTAECAQAAADFFTKNQRFPTQEEGDAMLAGIKRAHIKDYKMGNVTKAQLEEVRHAVRASKGGPERVKDIAAHLTAVTVD